MKITCPKCQMDYDVEPDEALQCDCGYELQQGKVVALGGDVIRQHLQARHHTAGLRDVIPVIPPKSVNAQLIRCPACGRSISKNAPACPGCGAYINRSVKFRWYHPFFIIFGVLVIIVTGLSWNIFGICFGIFIAIVPFLRFGRQ